MANTLTQDDFIQGYTDLNTFPKIVNWATDQPLVHGDMQITATVLQRKQDETTPWEFIPTLKVSSASVSTSEDLYEDDPFIDDADVLLTPEKDFDSAIDSILDEANEIALKYSEHINF